MKFITCHALLLNKIILANDDGMLEFFTAEEGTITVFVPKLGRSKKKKIELDYFRVLLLELTQGRGSYRLKSVSTISYFNGIANNYDLYEQACDWLMILRKIDFYGDCNDLFLELVKFFGSLNLLDFQKIKLFDAFFRMKILDYLGVISRFDILQTSVYFDVSHFKFYANYRENLVFIKNKDRQVLEFLRRANFNLFKEKLTNLPVDSLVSINVILEKLEVAHGVK